MVLRCNWGKILRKHALSRLTRVHRPEAALEGFMQRRRRETPDPGCKWHTQLKDERELGKSKWGLRQALR